jgi:hypothetical protein
MKFCIFSILVLPVAAVAADTNDALTTLVPAYGELPPTFGEQHQGPIIVASSAVIAFAFLFLKVMLRPEIKIALPSETVARQALVKLQREPEDGNCLSAVSQILRRYVSEAFNLPNHELTTAEFCRAIESNPQIGVEPAGIVSSFLRECDVQKFSPAKSAPTINAASRALELVNEIEKRRAGMPAQTSTLK